MKYFNTTLIVGLLLTLFLSSCVKQGEADYPSYLVVDTMLLKTQPDEGAATTRMPLVWVWANNEFRGGYPVGNKIPLLMDGEVDIELRPGIYTDGEAVRTDVYFNMKAYKETINLKRLETTHIEPTFIYDDYVTFSLVEGFEDGNVFIQDLDNNPNTIMERVRNNARSGEYCGRLKVSPQDSANAVGMHSPLSDFARGGETNMWIELDFKGNTDLVVGIAGLNDMGGQYNLPFISLKPQDDYRKVYLDLTEDIIRERAISVSVYLMAAYNRAYKEENQSVYVDNFKIINN